MSLKHSLLSLATLSVILSLGTIVSPTAPQSVRAEPLQASKGQDTPRSEYLNTPFEPPVRGAPRSTLAGGSRGCTIASAEDPVVALIPQDHLALTTSATPTLFWHIPQTVAQSAQQLVFKLKDSNDGATFYQTTLPLPARSEIISLNLSNEPNAKPLKVGEMYHWYLVAVCDPEDPSANTFVDGWIEHIDAANIPVQANSTLEASLQGASLPQQFSLYAKTGIWHDALETLARIRHSQPHDAIVLSSWSQLLNSVGLNQISQAPLAQSSAQQTTADR